MTLLGNDGQIYRLCKLYKKEEAEKRIALTTSQRKQEWATLNTITVHSESGMNTDSAVIAGKHLCWLDDSCKVVMLNTK